MNKEPRTPQASRLRQRKFEIIRHLPLLDDQLPGTLTRSYTRCGKPTCRCAKGEGHLAWSLTYTINGERHVERIPAQWAQQVRRRGRAAPGIPDTHREVLAHHAK